MIDVHLDLAWLPRAPSDFKLRCLELSKSEQLDGDAIRPLATHALDINQLARIARVIRPALRDGRTISGLRHLNVGLLLNGTTSYASDAIAATAARHGLSLHVVEPEYDQLVQEAVNPDSKFRNSSLDAVIIGIDYRSLDLNSPFGDLTAAETCVDKALVQIRLIVDCFSLTGTTCVVQTIVGSPETLFGSLERSMPGSLAFAIDSINSRIRSEFSSGTTIVLDTAALATTVGLSRWHDNVQWNMAKIACSMAAIPLYADHICRVLASHCGLSRRVLVLDLDNTLWHGIIGDDGLDGIIIGQGDAVGEAHLALQAHALRLRDRGILLAVSSKNNDEVARQPFRSHPDMLLKEAHFAAFQANWSDKASNIQAIADELNLTTSSLVFVDDNPAERALVRDRLPMVAVPEMPEDPTYYSQILSAAGYFEATRFSSEDLARVDFYDGNAKRLQLANTAASLDDYLLSLKMEITFAPFDEIGRSRITQLINKSNQFNLTTRRYTDLDVSALQSDPDVITLQVRLKDTFGDNGMICVVICRRESEAYTIDTWLMSCRVLKRRVEEAVLTEIAMLAHQRGAKRLIGVYRPTEKNSMVEDHYPNLGFQFVATQENCTVWEMLLNDLPARANLPFSAVRPS